jgi:hypothetical protein
LARKTNQIEIMIQKLFSHWKTSCVGVGMIVLGLVHLVYALMHHALTEVDCGATIMSILGGIGFISAGDAANSEKNAVAIDKINLIGPDASAAPLAAAPTNPPPPIL